MKNIRNFLGEHKIGLVDIGASGGLEPRWLTLGQNIKAFLFEPDKRSFENLAKHDYVEKIFNIGLGASESKETIYLCKKPQVSSLLKPRHNFLSHFQNSERFNVISEESIDLSTLDICLGDIADDCDFVKIDTQGTELDILKGGDTLLNSQIIGLELEIEFVRMYEEQPLFGDVCAYLDDKGYEFFDFVNLCRWERDKYTLYGQAVFGDALFLRSPEVFAELLRQTSSNLAHSKAKKYIAIAALYNHIDLLPVCVEHFSSFLSTIEIEEVNKLHKKLVKRRKIPDFIFRVSNRLLRPFGIKITGFQNA